MTAHAASAPAFNGWLDEFFASYYRHRPVNATFTGVHDYDNLLPDVSPQGFDALRAESATLLSRLRELPDESLTPAETLDRTLAEDFLEISEWELQSPHFAHGNPSAFTGDAIFGVLSLFLRPFAPMDERVEHAVERLEGLPAYLESARAVLRSAPTAWTERALRECAAARAFLDGGVRILCHGAGPHAENLRTSAHRAAGAFAHFEEWLRTDLLRHPSKDYACGGDILELLLRRAHHVETSLADLERDALQQIGTVRAYLEEHAREFGASTPSEALAQLRTLHLPADRYYAAYGEVWEASRQSALEHRLLTWPDFPIEYVPQPEWARDAAPGLYFLFYRSPAPFDQVLPVHYLVTPIEPDMSPEETERRLQATNTSVIKLNHVVHHGGIGHHVQNWHAFRAASRIGQMAAADCASRIAMLCAGTMSEGWACYATELMDECGFLTPLESYAERHSRLRMAARTVADIRLHTGRWSLEETAAFYVDTVGMPPDAARGEAVKNSMFPGTALMYLLGTDQIHELRKDLTRAAPSAFDLQRFHDRFLSFGSIPVSLAACEMRREVDHAE